MIGRGYRFLPAVTVEADVPVSDFGIRPQEVVEALAAPDVVQGIRPHRRYSALLAMLTVAPIVVGIIGLVAWTTWPQWGAQQPPQITAPRLSIVVLPFQNLGGDPGEDYLADGVTDDLTSDLSHIPEAFVIGSTSARAYKGRVVDAKQTGRELGVRYVVEGSVRRVGDTLRLNVKLISTETGAHVWSGRFDEPIADLAAGQDAILARMRGTLGVSLIEAEVARGRHVPPATPDAFDLILRARALRNQPFSRQRYGEALLLYEQALRLDSSSVLALTGAAAMLIDMSTNADGWIDSDYRQRVEALLARARDIAPASEEYRGVYAYWLSVEDRCQQTMAAARYMVENYANPTYGYGILGTCLVITGHSEEAIPLFEKAIRVNPLGPALRQRIAGIGSAHLYLGHHEQAINWLERALAANPGYRDSFPGGLNRKLAVAYAGAGRDADARRALAAADRDWPFDTVRGHWPDDINPGFAAQVRAFQESLRNLGERDHADEEADFGILADAVLYKNLDAYTPMTTPGAPTIRTTELQRFIAERKPLIIDPLLYFWGNSIPGAIGLRNAGIGGTVTDGAQERLGHKMAELTRGDLAMPIVAVGWNSERFDGRNLALRLVALGYTHVVWYRGGREAWEAAGLPETELTPQKW